MQTPTYAMSLHRYNQEVSTPPVLNAPESPAIYLNACSVRLYIYTYLFLWL